MDIIKRLEESDVDMKDFMANLKMIEICGDLIEQSTLNVKAGFLKANLYQKERKRDINKLADHARKYVRKFDKEIAKGFEGASMAYGELSDKIHEASIKFLIEVSEIKEKNAE